MAGNADIKLLIGAKGGSSPSGSSAVEIRQALQSALSGKNGIKVNVRLTSNAANNLKQEIQKVLNANGGIEVKIKGQIADAVAKASSGSAGSSRNSGDNSQKQQLKEINELYKSLSAVERKMASLRMILTRTTEFAIPRPLCL